MKVRPHILSPSVACRIAVLCAAVVVIGADAAHAGNNVWTSQGPQFLQIPETVSVLSINPAAPSTLYAGTSLDGVFKSTNAGATWSATGLYNTPANALAIDPTTPTTLYSGGHVIFKTTDGGTTWGATDLSTTMVNALAIDPAAPSTIYAGTGRDDPGVYKSTDAGASWHAILFNIAVNALAIDPNTPTTLYAGTGNIGLSGGVLKSTDAGSTWGTSTIPSIPFIHALAVDPFTPSTLYAGAASNCYPLGGCVDGGVYKSTNGGTTWATTTSLIDSAARDVTALAIDALTPSTLYAGTDGGVFKSIDAGATWFPLNTGLASLNVSALAIDPLTPTTVYAGTDGGVFSIQQVALCVGDCGGINSVAVNDIITLVNIALGTAQPSACPDGIPNGAQVKIAMLIQAVNNALNGCGVG